MTGARHAVVFDLDGTLLDSLEDIANASNAVLEEIGRRPHPVEDYRAFVGSGVAVLFERALAAEAPDRALIERCSRLFAAEYAKTWNVHTHPFAGVPELLDALADRGLPMGVLSNKPHDFACKCVEELLSNWTFGAVYGQREGVPKKPDPTAALQTAAELGVPPAECLYLGDSPVDMQTALAAGMFPVGAAWGFRSVEQLTEAGAARIARVPGEVLELLEND